MADRQYREHRLAPVLIQLSNRVGRVIRGHTAEDLGNLSIRAILEELALMMIVELLEDICLELAVVLADGLDDLLALASGGRLDEIGDLRRMELGELRVRNAQTHRGHMTHERLDARPIE